MSDQIGDSINYNSQYWSLDPDDHDCATYECEGGSYGADVILWWDEDEFIFDLDS